jgi:hypothetical protein
MKRCHPIPRRPRIRQHLVKEGFIGIINTTFEEYLVTDVDVFFNEIDKLVA